MYSSGLGFVMRGAAGGVGIRELSQRPQGDIQSAESGAIGLAQGIA